MGGKVIWYNIRTEKYEVSELEEGLVLTKMMSTGREQRVKWDGRTEPLAEDTETRKRKVIIRIYD